ncbi:MAG: nitroreductase family protein [Dehalococcoidia bacterium]|jgi:nicotinate-nucleotide--dimethylbenzimidazole phosphoribosyltransferase|nr:nitroreductase family protein [Dehalococcoidia bacterium]
MSTQPGDHPQILTYEGLRALVAGRRSVRRFRPDPVSRESIERILDVARLAPSAGNSQPWEFVVVTDAAMRSRVARAAASLFSAGRKRDPEFNWSISVQPFLSQAPVLIVVLGDRRVMAAYPSILRGNILMRQSLSNCVLALQLAAASLGLATAWGTLQGGSPESEIRDLLRIPDAFTIDHIVPVGYADEVECARAAALAPARERASRRRPLDAIVHWERYAAEKERSDGAVEQFIWSETVTRVRRADSQGR